MTSLSEMGKALAMSDKTTMMTSCPCQEGFRWEVREGTLIGLLIARVPPAGMENGLAQSRKIQKIVHPTPVVNQ